MSTAGELLQMNWMSYVEYWTYNSRLQMTGLRVAQSGQDQSRITYAFPAAPGNNGRTRSQDWWTFIPWASETITHSYDNWNRLTYSDGSDFTQSFSYYGFGNLTAKAGTGTAPSAAYPTNPANNRLTNETYDNNGNIARAMWGYDFENRLMNTGSKMFLYDSSNHKVWEYESATAHETVSFYGLDGQRMCAYDVVERSSDYVFARGATALDVYFAGKHLAVEDRLGSSGNGGYFFAYGAPRGDATGARFATYRQDTTLGLDYAINRWYMPGMGRFASADPYRASGGPGEPGSWNRYSYVHGDPTNRRDPSGLISEGPDGTGGYQYQLADGVLAGAVNRFEMFDAYWTRWGGGYAPEIAYRWGQSMTACHERNVGYLGNLNISPNQTLEYGDNGGLRWEVSDAEYQSLLGTFKGLIAGGQMASSSSTGALHVGDVGSPNTDYRVFIGNGQDRSTQIVIGPPDNHGFRLVYADTDAFNTLQSVGQAILHGVLEVIPGALGFNTSCLGT